jgi:hypothetical protein
MRVKTTEKCFVNNCIREAGEVFEYTGPKVSYFEYLDEVQSDNGGIASESDRRRPGRPRKVTTEADQTA